MELLTHAAGCDACSALLADSAGEEAAAAKSQAAPALALKSASPTWKREMLARLELETNQSPKVRLPFASRRNWLWAAAAAALVAIMVGSSNPALWLLNRSSDRTFEFRVSGMPYRPLTGSRGAERAQSPAFLAAKLLIALRGKIQADSASWLQARAQAAILERGGSSELDTAIDALMTARLVDSKNTAILNDLAVALLLRAGNDLNSEQVRAEDVSRSIEVLNDAIKIRPDAALYFNLALALEQQRTYNEALDAWDRFLKAEPTGGWAEEARRHIETLRARQQARASSQVRRAEDSITPLAAQGFRSSANLDAASIADDLSTHHGDLWMHDFLASQKQTPNQPGVAGLQASVQAFSAGDASGGETRARQAAAEFSRSGNAAGVALSSFEWAYTLQRLSKANSCVDIARSNLPVVANRHYRWVEIQLRLTLALCLGMQEHFDGAYEEIMVARSVAKDAGYSSLELRSLGMASSILREVGSYRQALAFDVEGLRRYWGGEGTKSHAYQFYFGLATSLAGLQYSRAAAAPMGEAVRLASLQADRSLEAMARSRYGGILIEAEHLEDAARELVQSEALFDGLPETPALVLYRSYARLSQASLDGRRSETAKGLRAVGELEAAMSSLQNPSIETDLWHIKSELLTRAGYLTEGEEPLRKLLTLGDAALQSAPVGGDRSALVRGVSDAVNLLTQRYVDQGNPREAWRVWTQYNSCFKTLDSSASSSVRLVYTNLPAGPVVLVATQTRTEAVRISSAAELSGLISAFRRAVANPEEPVERVRNLAHRVREQLIDPIQTYLDAGQTIYIAADGPFSAVPFAALVSRDGQWFADRHRIIYSPPLGGAPVIRGAGIKQDSILLATSYGNSTEIFGTILPALPDVSAEAASATMAFPRHKVLTGDDATASEIIRNLDGAEVFHFSGHAVTLAADAALVVAPDNSTSSKNRLLWASKIPANSLHNLRLAVLAACSTGRPAEEMRYPSSDMARAFLLAGVPQVVASSWDADSSATGELMRRFYDLLRQGATPEDALFASAAALRKQQLFAQPYYWAAFDYFRR